MKITVSIGKLVFFFKKKNVKFEGIRMCEKIKYFLNSMTSWVIFATQTQCKGVDSS